MKPMYHNAEQRSGSQWRWLLFLLLLPFVLLLWPPLYNFDHPELFGVPFFYWFQLAGIGVTSFITWLLHHLNLTLEPMDHRKGENIR